MPKLPIDYQKSIIYKWLCKDPGITEIYVGSTTNWYSRTKDHKGHLVQENSKAYNTPKYRFIRDHGAWDNWRMIEIEKYPCRDKRELEAREQFWIDELAPKLNSMPAYRSESEKKERLSTYKAVYYQEHKEEKKQYDAAYRSLPEQQVKDRARRKTPTQCECGCVTTYHGIRQHLKTKRHAHLMKLKTGEDD